MYGRRDDLLQRTIVHTSIRPYDSPSDQRHERIERARVLALAEPEDGVLADLRLRMRPGNLDQQRDAIIVGELGDGKDGLLLNLGVGLVLDHVAEGFEGAFGGLLTEPEDSVFADVARP